MYFTHFCLYINLKWIRRKMECKKIKLKELKSIQQDLSDQLELIKQSIQQLEKEIDEQNCPIASRINEHKKNIIVGDFTFMKL